MKEPLYRWLCPMCGVSDEAESAEMARLNIDVHMGIAHPTSREAVRVQFDPNGASWSWTTARPPTGLVTTRRTAAPAPERVARGRTAGPAGGRPFRQRWSASARPANRRSVAVVMG